MIQDGDFITMDFGAMYKGYCADMTRTVAVSYVTDEMEKVYMTVLARPWSPAWIIHQCMTIYRSTRGLTFSCLRMWD